MKSDFYCIEAVSTSIRALMRIKGVYKDNIKPVIRYGKNFPHQEYVVQLKFYDVNELGNKVAASVCESYLRTLPRIDKVRYLMNRYSI